MTFEGDVSELRLDEALVRIAGLRMDPEELELVSELLNDARIWASIQQSAFIP